MVMFARSSLLALAVVALLALVGGCVVGDQLTTITLRPDGSADVVTFRSNLRSDQEGAKGATEISEYQARFDAHTEDDLARVTQAGGMLLEATWLRRQVPLANVVRATFPNAQAFENYYSFKNEQGSEQLKTKFATSGNRRTLTFTLDFPKGEGQADKGPLTVERVRQALADGISETRIALAEGKITRASGFIVAADKQSALLDAAALGEILRTTGKGELAIEWEVP
jgi:hypothetical protein